MQDPFVQFLITAVAILVAIVIARAIFSIPKFLKYQRAQTKLLGLIAEKHGVNSTTVATTLRDADQGYIYGDGLYTKEIQELEAQRKAQRKGN